MLGQNHPLGRQNQVVLQVATVVRRSCATILPKAYLSHKVPESLKCPHLQRCSKIGIWHGLLHGITCFSGWFALAMFRALSFFRCHLMLPGWTLAGSTPRFFLKAIASVGFAHSTTTYIHHCYVILYVIMICSCHGHSGVSLAVFKKRIDMDWRFIWQSTWNHLKYIIYYIYI